MMDGGEWSSPIYDLSKQSRRDGMATALENAVAMYDLRFTTYDLFKQSLQDGMA